MAGVYGGDWVSWLEFFATVLPAYAWAIAAIVVALIFRPIVGKVLPRLAKLGPSGAEFHREGTQRSTDVAPPPIQSPHNEEPLTDPVAIELEEKINRDLGNIDDNEKEQRLIRALTYSQLNRHFALAYANIFGSQIRALERLNAQSVTHLEAQQLFEELQKVDDSFKDWTLKNYLQFLFAWRFIKEEGGALHITPTGQNFLVFITTSHLSKDRLH